ncbi:MAG: hypothetical protein ACYC5X_02830, partial [Syntrophales bacterium]
RDTRAEIPGELKAAQASRSVSGHALTQRVVRGAVAVNADRVMIDTRKTTQDILQEEMARERVTVLVRAGERLTEALEKLRQMENDIAEAMALWRLREGNDRRCRQRLHGEINGKIRAYNLQRDHVKTRYYYLIVTREALGITHHQRLEEIYRVPPKKRCLPERAGLRQG